MVTVETLEYLLSCMSGRKHIELVRGSRMQLSAQSEFVNAAGNVGPANAEFGEQ